MDRPSGESLSPIDRGFQEGLAHSQGNRLVRFARAAVSRAQGAASRGPFKEAFRHRFVLVHGTRGTGDENAWSMARARYDAEVFWYRGNGSVDRVADTEFLDPARKAEFQDRSVILYGHAAEQCRLAGPAGAEPGAGRAGKVRIGARVLSGDDLACIFLRPRPESDVASVGVVAGTGMAGIEADGTPSLLRLGSGLSRLHGLHRANLEEGAAPILAAGYFGPDWGVETGEFLWQE